MVRRKAEPRPERRAPGKRFTVRTTPPRNRQSQEERYSQGDKGAYWQNREFEEQKRKGPTYAKLPDLAIAHDSTDGRE